MTKTSRRISRTLLSCLLFPLQYPRFWYAQRVRGFSAPRTPHFGSEETTAWFTQALAGANSYVEFGSGGSTYLAARQGIPFVSVDSDRYFMDTVRRQIVEDDLHDPTSQRFQHVDVGLTKKWGHPVMFVPPSTDRRARFRAYSDFPETTRTPDLVLVDGSFRVACALKALRALGRHQGWTLLIDDYLKRPEYRVIEDFGQLDRMVGRMAVFRSLCVQDMASLDEAIREHELDPA